MIYEQFLFSQLLRDIIPEFDTIAYDELYDFSNKIYSNDFFKSSYNNTKIDLYNCIEEYIKNNKENLLSKIKNLI